MTFGCGGSVEGCFELSVFGGLGDTRIRLFLYFEWRFSSPISSLILSLVFLDIVMWSQNYAIEAG